MPGREALAVQRKGSVKRNVTLQISGAGRQLSRSTQRKPTWLVEVSTGSGCRAAGR